MNMNEYEYKILFRVHSVPICNGYFSIFKYQMSLIHTLINNMCLNISN